MTTGSGQRRSLFAEWPLGAALLGVGIGLFVVATDHFRRGTVILAVSVLVATFLRMILPERRAGLLAVRSRIVDVLVLGALGSCLTVLALVVPPPP